MASREVNVNLKVDDLVDVKAIVDKLRAERDAAVSRAKQAEAEVKQLRAHRLVMAVFGVPDDAPQPFALLGDDDKPFALGVQWPGGAVTVKQTPPQWPGNVTSASLDDYFNEYGASPVMWLSEDLGTLADMEERAMRAEQAVTRVRELAAAWDGGPCLTGYRIRNDEDSDSECLHCAADALRRALAGPGEQR